MTHICDCVHTSCTHALHLISALLCVCERELKHSTGGSKGSSTAMKLLSGNGSSPSTVAFVVLPLTFLVFTGFLVYRYEFDLQCFLAGCGDKSTASNFAGAPVVAVRQEPDFRALVGILTKADLYERRQLMRHAYALQPKPRDAQIDVRFVLCNLTTEEQRVLVAMEIMLYGDIIILNCTENMNDGKTYTYFSSVVGMFNGTTGGGRPPYDFVTKCDDDTYFRLANFADALRKAPRDDLYLGFLAPCDKPDAPYHFMAGMGYTISWDVVEWVSTEEEVRKHKVGVEDILTSIWMSVGRKVKHWVDMNPRMYDYLEGPRECFRHEFLPDTIAVHKLKTNFKWARTLSYFNVTKGLKPSKLYHI